VGGGLLLLLLVFPRLRGRPQAPAGASPPPAASTAANTPAPAPPQVSPPQLAAVQQAIDAAAPELGDASIHFRLLGGGEAAHEAEAERTAASLIKVPLLAALEHAWHSGTLQRTGLDEGRARKMITESDNPSADAIIERVGMSQVNTWLEDHAYRHTHLKHLLLGPRPDGPNVTSAADMTRMLVEMLEGRLVNPAASAEMRKLLLASERRTRIPAGLPPEVTVGNKTGTLNGIVNDAAFVELPDGRRYALAVLVERARSDEAVSRRIAELSRKVYEALTAPAS
jgi:beta-lactamase class A